MPRLEKKIGIVSTPEKIYNILLDDFNTPKWNPTISAIIETENNKIQLDTDLGGFTINNIETAENKSVIWRMEESDLESIGYILTPKTKATEVTIWIEFDNKKLLKLLKKTANLGLTGLKNYVEFIEKGGDPDLYNKWDLLVNP